MRLDSARAYSSRAKLNQRDRGNPSRGTGHQPYHYTHPTSGQTPLGMVCFYSSPQRTLKFCELRNSSSNELTADKSVAIKFFRPLPCISSFSLLCEGKNSQNPSE